MPLILSDKDPHIQSSKFLQDIASNSARGVSQPSRNPRRFTGGDPTTYPESFGVYPVRVPDSSIIYARVWLGVWFSGYASLESLINTLKRDCLQTTKLLPNSYWDKVCDIEPDVLEPLLKKHKLVDEETFYGIYPTRRTSYQPLLL